MRSAKTVIVRAALLVIAAAVTFLFAQHTLATRYKAYDDEGYFLLSIDHYLSGEHLYTQFFTQYGPFYFFAQGGLYRLLGLGVSHDSGRLIVLLLWLLSAGLGAWFVYRISRDGALAAAACLACVAVGRVLANEPGHPQQIALPLLMLACALAAGRGGAAAFLLLGAIGSALFFTKINVGIFYFAALAVTVVWAMPAGRVRKLAGAAMLLYATFSPALLMRQSLSDWALPFCLTATASGTLTFLAALTLRSEEGSWRPALWAALGASAGALLITAGALGTGMNLSTLVNGVVIAPLHHPKVLSIPMEIPALAVPLWMIAAGVICRIWWTHRAGRAVPEWVDALRCAAGLFTVVLLATFFHKNWAALVFLPLGLIPGSKWRRSDALVRVFVAALAAAQFVQAYPVSGSQQGISSAPLMLWGFLCIYDGAFALVRVPRAAIGAVLTLAFAGAMLGSGLALPRYREPASQLPGASTLHLPVEDEQRYRALAAGIREHCATLFTLPGMGSLNYFSGVPAPNGFNMTGWVKAFSNAQQEEVRSRLQSGRACAVYNRNLAGFWGITVDDEEASPLAGYIKHNMRPIARYGDYELRVGPGAAQ